MSTIDLVRQAQAGPAAQRFWALVLLVAVKDDASEVRFVPQRGKRRLTYVIGGTEYDLLPPPRFLMADIERAARQLLRPQTLWKRLAGFFGRVREGFAERTGTFSATVGEHRVTVAGAADPDQARVTLKLAPSLAMIAAAQVAWEDVQGARQGSPGVES